MCLLFQSNFDTTSIKQKILPERVWLIVYIGLIGFVLFCNLNYFPIRQWDEARLAVSAQEMYINQNFLVPVIGGEPDNWNLKPPLMIWLQVLSMRIFGWNEWAIRLPAAIATFSLCMLMFYFAKYRLKQPMIGFFAGLVLVTSNGFIDFHEARTGDYDALLTLFTTTTILFYFSFIESNQNSERNKYLKMFFICLTLGIYAKSVSILLFMPALLIYTICRQKISDVLGNSHFYIGIISSITVVLIYYLIREKLTPGYLQAVCENELGGRYLKTLENHKHSFSFYYDNLRQFQFEKWFWTLPSCFFLGLLNKDERIKKITLYCGLCAMVYFLIISSAQTKLQWYDMPLYPLMTLIIGVGFNIVFNFIIFLISEFRKKWLMIIPFAIIVIAFVDPYKNISQKVSRKSELPWDEKLYQISHYLRNQIRDKKDLTGYKLFYDEYNLQLVFYTNILFKKGQAIEYIKSIDNIKEGMKIIVDKAIIQNVIKEKFNFMLIDKFNGVEVYHISSPKNPIPENTP
jgi:4-amino-4-deoxy-L-arabinose transferase-like glycosyltransferase